MNGCQEVNIERLLEMRFERELLKGLAPTLVMELLTRQAMYGYELSEALAKRSNGIFNLGKGTLYPLLYNLEAKNLVKGKLEDTDSGRKRRYYSITSKGKGQLAKQKEQLKELHTGLNLVFGGALSVA